MHNVRFNCPTTHASPASLHCSTFVSSWQHMMRTHDQLGDNRLRFAVKLGEMSEELLTLSKEVDKNRKQVRPGEAKRSKLACIRR